MAVEEGSRRRAIAAWCAYDWAYSAFNTVVVTFVIAAYFVRAVARDQTSGTASWAWAQASAGLVIAILAAPLGAIADHGGRQRSMLAVCTVLTAFCTALLWLVRPAPSYAALALTLVALATISFEAATVFYNAMLPDIAPPGRIGRISELAWGLGYAGGLACLTLCLVLLVNPDPPLLGLARAAAEPVRATALLAAGWILLFSWPLLVFVPNRGRRLAWAVAVREGMRSLRVTLQAVSHDRPLARFLVARMLYTDGLTTLFAFGAIFAAGTFGMDARAVLLLGISLNVTAGIGAAGFAFIEDRIGPQSTILVALGALTALGAALLLAQSVTVFWILALGLGVFVGPAQAASRSLMARLAPTATRTAHFGLYALSGRATGFVGPAALGFVTAASGSQRAGMTVILALLASGGALLAATRLSPTID